MSLFKPGAWMAMGRRGRRLPLVPIAVVLLVGVLASSVANREAARTAAAESTFGAVLGDLEARLSVSHIRVEERVAGDRTVSVARDIEANQVAAAGLCRSLRDGGPTPAGAVSPSEDADVARLVARICRRVDTFRELTGERLRAPLEERQAGSPAEQRYDAAFASVLEDGATLRTLLQELGAEQRARMQAIQLLVALALAVLVVAAVLVIRRRDRQLAIAGEERDSILRSAGEGILAFGQDGTIRFANPAGAAMLGWQPLELIGLPIDRVLADEGQPSEPPPWLRGRGGRAKGDDQELRRRDGSTFPIAYTLAPAEAGKNRDALVLTFEDISDRRRAEARREAELAELRVIKEALIPPTIPSVPGLRIAASYEPAREGVAGDFYLVVGGPHGSTVIVLGDVAGKGVVAARRGAYLRAALATFAPYAQSPCQLLELGNRALFDATGVTARFVTAICAIVKPTDGTVVWASAGHPAPLRLDSGTALEGRPGLPLGILRDLQAHEHEEDLPPGAGLLLFTDGLTEARPGDAAHDVKLLGVDAIAAEVRECGGAEPEAVAEALRSLADRHSGGRLADDLCVVALRTVADAEPAREPGVPSAA